MELIFQAIWWLLQLLSEILLSAFGELLAELLGRSMSEPFHRPKPVRPWLAAIGYAIFGVVAGAISLWAFPMLFISARWLQVVNLLVSPLLAGVMMERLGAWRETRGQETIALDSFLYGFIFAFAMGLVRFVWADAP